MHLPDVRLRARAVRRDRRRDALVVQPGIRDPPAALRLVHRQPAGPVPAASDRVRAAQRDLYGAVQAGAAPTRQRGARPRLERSAYADHRRYATARLPGRGTSRFRGRGRRGQGRQHDRVRPARARRPQRAQPQVDAQVRRPAADQGRDRELPRGPRRGDGGAQQPRGSGVGHAQGALQPRALDRARGLHGGTSRPSSSASLRAARSGCGPRTSSPARAL